MKNIFAIIIFYLPFMSPGLAQVNLNPPHGSSNYDAFTVFSPDAPNIDTIRKDVILVFHGFKSATPNGTYKRIRKAFLKTHTTLGINYNPLDVERTLSFLNDVNKKWLKGRNVVVLGTSVGAYWANRFGQHIHAKKIVLLNPIIDPIRQLSIYVGKRYINPRRVQSFIVNAAALERYADLKDLEQNKISRIVVLTTDDKFLSYRDALNYFAGKNKTTVVIYPTGGHTLNLRKHRARASIVDFILNNR